jgi:hypothetical protein
MAHFEHARLELMPVLSAPVRSLVLSDFSFIWAVGSKIEFIFQVEEPITVSHLGFAYAGAANLPPKQRVSLQGVDPSGQADGVTITQQIYEPPPAGMDTWKDQFIWVPVPPASVSRGQFLAMVIEYSSGLVNNSNYSTYYSYFVGTSSSRGVFPYTADNPLGTRIKRFDRPIFGYRSVTKVYGFPMFDIEELEYSAPAQKGMAFTLDVGFGDFFKVAGAVLQIQPTTSTNQGFAMVLYQNQTELGRVAMDTDWKQTSTFIDDRIYQLLFDEATLAQLSFGQQYILAVVPLFVTTGMRLTTSVCASNLEVGGFPGGPNMYLVERDGPGQAWSHQIAKRPLMDLIISEWGAPLEERVGPHMKLTPKYNDPHFVQHADDQIENNILEIPEGVEPHEFPGVPIGNALESYSGYDTVEVFKDPDVARSIEFLIHPEQPLEQLKFLQWDPYENGTFEIVFRLRAAEGSATYREVIRYVRVILPP